ncbi:MAG TPA: Gfo/Idh/MocA family oxidoreductase [bacterium]|nr:Gfo/Idh/MocA family oxidoreductase [bacterium]
MRLAVIGIGKMGMLHAGIMNALDVVELVAVSDTTKFLLNSVKSLKNDLSVYDDYVKMLDNEQPDLVVIATPVFLHVPMAWECAKRGISFFLEKPLAPKSSDAENLLKKAEEKDLTTMVGYMMRYIDTFMKAKTIIDSGVLGKLITFKSTIYVAQLFKTGKGWRYSKEQSGGGVLVSQATHLVDLLNWFFGDVVRVSGHIKSHYSQDVEDFAHVYFEFKSGLTGWMDSSWSIRHHRLLQVNIEIHAENGDLFVCDDYVKLYLENGVNDYQVGWTNFFNPDLFKGVEMDIGGPHFSRQDIAFVNAIKKGSKLESDLRNAYQVQRVVDAAYLSSEKHGEPISL